MSEHITENVSYSCSTASKTSRALLVNPSQALSDAAWSIYSWMGAGFSLSVPDLEKPYFPLGEAPAACTVNKAGTQDSIQ